ncbi:putative membrane protein [Granulicella aggregans]|uniref:Putative membrane protein n=1 Tax=Granulicella aggregans TaxID=474949 RepID=A0A7W7Z935_9BACT|nr:DUF1772 domain-containing protein [Granulicella aggregans]MBB5055422.1 putative membrane protein [Granulicella aggregans]
MHIVNLATLFIVLSLVGVEFSVSAFVNPAAWRLDPEPQLKLLSRLAVVLGKVMPIWYPACALLLGIQTWLHWHTADSGILLAADTLWVIASVGGIIFLVPLNNRIAAGDSDWQQIHRAWDGRHRLRITVLAVAAILLSYVTVC